MGILPILPIQSRDAVGDKFSHKPYGWLWINSYRIQFFMVAIHANKINAIHFDMFFAGGYRLIAKRSICGKTTDIVWERLRYIR